MRKKRQKSPTKNERGRGSVVPITTHCHARLSKDQCKQHVQCFLASGISGLFVLSFFPLSQPPFDVYEKRDKHRNEGDTELEASLRNLRELTIYADKTVQDNFQTSLTSTIAHSLSRSFHSFLHLCFTPFFPPSSYSLLPLEESTGGVRAELPSRKKILTAFNFPKDFPTIMAELIWNNLPRVSNHYV